LPKTQNLLHSIKTEACAQEFLFAYYDYYENDELLSR